MTFLLCMSIITLLRWGGLVAESRRILVAIGWADSRLLQRRFDGDRRFGDDYLPLHVSCLVMVILKK